MKKACKILALLVAVFSLAACAKKEGSNSSQSFEYKSLKAYIASDEVKTELDATKALLDQMGMSVIVKADKNAIVYEFTLSEDYTQDLIDMLKESLPEQKETQQAMMTLTIQNIQKKVNVKNLKIVQAYFSSDKKEIARLEFTEK